MIARVFGCVIIALLMAALPALAPVYAQEGSEAAEEETTQASGISASVYKKFAEVQEFQEADDYASAYRVLDQLKAKGGLSSTELIYLYQLYGILYFNQERYKEAITAFETQLQQEDITERQRTDTLLTLAQLHFQIEDWQGAIRILTGWLDSVSNPPPDPLVMLGSAYYQIEEYQKMVEPLERAIQIARERDKEIKEQWWLLLRVAYYELENYRKVTDVLEILVVNWPKKEYWTMLSGMYGELDRTTNQLGAYEAAYDQGLLEKSAELVTLAQLLMQAEAGYKAAVVLEKGFAAGQIEENETNYRLQSQAWQMAAEYEKAVPPLKKAAQISSDGELQVRLANSYLNLGLYDECAEAARAGLNKGGLKRPGIAQELLGMCLVEKEQYENAKTAFRKAARDKAIEKRARSWISYIESEQARLAQLNASLEQARVARDAARKRAAERENLE